MSPDTIAGVLFVAAFIGLLIAGAGNWGAFVAVLASMAFTTALIIATVQNYSLTDVADSVCAQTPCAGRTPPPTMEAAR